MLCKNSDIYNYLNTSGIKHVNIGYRYLITAIQIGIEYPYKLKKIENLYKEIAKLYMTTPTAVEKSIRYSLSILDKNNSNKEYITRAVDDIICENNNIVFTHFLESSISV